MSIFIPKKVIEIVSKAISRANRGKLKATVGEAVYTVDFDHTGMHIGTTRPENQTKCLTFIPFDEMTADSMAEALTRSYIYDSENERDYRVKLETRIPNPNEPNETILACTYWIGRTGEQPWMTVQRFNWPRAIHFDLHPLG